MKNFLQNHEFQLDEVLFEHRNQNYGAYVLRHDAATTLTKSMFVGVSLFAAIAAMPFILNSFKTVPVTAEIPDGGYILTPIHIDDVIKPVTQVVPLKPLVATTRYIIPNPVKNPIVQTALPSVNEIKNTNIGIDNIKGKAPTISVTPPANVIPATSTTAALPKTDDNSAKTHVDIEAKFSTGIDGFRNGMIQNFDATDFDGIESTMRTTITFIVEKDGTISDVKASGGTKEFNQEAIKTLKSIRGKWTPAKLNGEIVRSYFSFPISMKFE